MHLCSLREMSFPLVVQSEIFMDNCIEIQEIPGREICLGFLFVLKNQDFLIFVILNICFISLFFMVKYGCVYDFFNSIIAVMTACDGFGAA